MWKAVSAIACRARSSWPSGSRRQPVRLPGRPDEIRAAGETGPIDEAVETDRFVRRQRADAAAALRAAPANLFRPRFSRRPAVAIVVSALLLAPVLLMPNPQDAVIAQQRQVREAANQQAEQLDELAKELESKGADAQDPRTRLAQELRDLARQLRDRPDQLDVNLARLARWRPTSERRSTRQPSSGRQD